MTQSYHATQPPPVEVRIICEGCYGDGDVYQDRQTIVHRGGDAQYTIEGERWGYNLTVFGPNGQVRLSDDVQTHNDAVTYCQQLLAKERE